MQKALGSILRSTHTRTHTHSKKKKKDSLAASSPLWPMEPLGTDVPLNGLVVVMT
jgi:hypothetical protein